jgi:hypothetical protein
MLAFERRVVDVLIESGDSHVRSEVTTFVESSLADMPTHLRAGVVAESVALTGVAAVVGTSRALRLAEASPVALLRQYVRLFRSLVLFAELEASPAS